MCGIIGYVGHRQSKEVLINALRRLEYRGYDSAGIAVLQDKTVELHRVEGRIEGLVEKIKNKSIVGTTGIGHTRWATHGAAVEMNAHPHRVGSVILVHNGIIENYASLRDDLIGRGRKMGSDTDSEIVAHLIDLEIEAGATLEKAVRTVLPKLRGTYAFVILSEKSPKEIVGVRNGCPLLIGVGEGESFFASDVQAVLSYTNKVVYLEDNQVAIIDVGGVKVTDAAGKAMEVAVKTIKWSADEIDKAGYDHYMLKEIYEQPQAIANTIEGNIDHKNEIIRLIGLVEHERLFHKINRVLIVACGTSLHAGLIGKYYIEQFAHIPADVDYASEFRYRNPVLTPDTLCIFISQSGETADTLAALRAVKKNGIPSLVICNVRESSLARAGDMVLYTNAGPEIGVASTKAFTTQVAMLYMFAVQVGHLRKSMVHERFKELTKRLIHLPILVEKTLSLDNEIQKIARKYHGFSCFFYVGRGIYYPVALEGALKLKEISYLHAEGYPAGELKHGPIALVAPDVVTLVLNPKSVADPSNPSRPAELSQMYYEKVMSNLEEVKARKGEIVSIGTQGDETLRKSSHHFLELPPAAWGLNSILLSIPLQLFAYHVAQMRGTDVDKPRNLAKSVTVE